MPTKLLTQVELCKSCKTVVCFQYNHSHYAYPQCPGSLTGHIGTECYATNVDRDSTASLVDRLGLIYIFCILWNACLGQAKCFDIVLL